MADPDKKLLPEDEDARAKAIEERLERLRKLHGWASDTVNVSPEEVKAVAGALDSQRKRPKAGRANLILRFSYGGRAEETVEVSDEQHDIGSGEMAKLRILHPSVSARHCRISREGDGFRVRDMNTQSGTWVNEQRIPLSSAIGDGDTLRCGEVVFTLSVTPPDAPPAAAASAATAPRPASQTMMVQSPWTGRTPRPGGAAAVEPETPVGPAAPAARAAVTGPAARCYIIYVDADGQEQEAEVPHDRPLVVGRRVTADLRLTDNGISSLHAAFEWVDGEVVVRDLGSTNGTWVNGERVPRAVLADAEVVRLGLTPVRIVLEADAPAAIASDATNVVRAMEDDEVEAPMESDEPEESDDDGAMDAPQSEDGPASWHLVYVTDQGAVASVILNQREQCVVAGEGTAAEISVHGRGLKPEHLQFDWSKTGLEVMQARRDALLKVNGKAVANTALQGGDCVSTGTLAIRVVRSPTVSAAQTHSQIAEWWGKLLKKVDPQIELLFVDPEAAGGRVELSIWGDGAAQVQQLSGAASDRLAANLTPNFLRLLFATMAQAGFPDVPRSGRGSVASPELSSFWGEKRADVVVSDRVTANSPRWREVRDFLRAVVGSILQ